MPRREPWRVAVDIGGTFTDIVLLGPGAPGETRRVHTKKVSSTVDNYAKSIAAGLAEMLVEARLNGNDIAEVLHATTVGSNAILELSGVKTGLITTKGFRDILEIRTLRMPRLYDLAWQKPPPLVERRLRLEVAERIDANGHIKKPLDEAEVERAIDSLVASGVEAIAVCFLNSYANPQHEQEVKRIIERRAKEITVCVSSEILPEIKEYERTSTTVINAYIRPAIEKYLTTLSADLRRIEMQAPVLMMQSNGGLMPAERAARFPIHIIESGPAAGVIGAHAAASQIGLEQVISFDMGGTTAKASLIENGQVTRAEEYTVGGGIMIGSRLLSGAGYTLKVPAIDLAEVGAGGGSIIWIDAGGSLQVGPKSAGAMPGPVCYSMGGIEPTITDANVILGYLNPKALAGGAVTLDAKRAQMAFEKKIARPMSLTIERAAYGAHQIVASNMIRAIRAVSSERGRDPRRFDLFGFGGNGPVFAAGMAKTLGIARVIVPPSAGVFSSFGLLYSDIEYHFSRTHRRLLSEAVPEELSTAFNVLESEAALLLKRDGFTGQRAQIRRAAKLRYQGQSYDLSVPVPPGKLTSKLLTKLASAFATEHERTYGHRAGKDEPVELTNISIVGQGIPEHRRNVKASVNGKVPAVPPIAIRGAFFGPEHGWLDTPILVRGGLTVRQLGPAIIEEYDATTVVPPGSSARLDEYGNIVIELL